MNGRESTYRDAPAERTGPGTMVRFGSHPSLTILHHSNSFSFSSPTMPPELQPILAAVLSVVALIVLVTRLRVHPFLALLVASPPDRVAAIF
jgi:hypothetical protein